MGLVGDVPGLRGREFPNLRLRLVPAHPSRLVPVLDANHGGQTLHRPLAGEVWTVIRIDLDIGHILGGALRHLVCDWTQPPAVGSPRRGKEGDHRLVFHRGLPQKLWPFLCRDFAHAESPSLFSVV